jgi:hypothetical protein
MIAIVFLLVRMLCDCFKANRDLNVGAIVSLGLSRALLNSAGCQIRVGHQPQNRQGARPHRAAA